jgi:lipopolysaccharide export system protein LptA
VRPPICALALALAFAAGAQPPPVEAPPVEAPPPRTGSPFDLGIESDEPLAINSEELEITQRDGQRLLVFSKQVVVERGDLRIQSDRLEAFYPQGASQPERLVATGSVRLVQGARRASCDQATYRREPERLVCSGQAQVEEDGSVLRGQTIEFDLAQDLVKVQGGASVLIQPKAQP